MRVVVVGAGVIGLSCAVRLAEAGHEVAVFARDLPPETTSSVAAALWYPYLAAPRERVSAWAGATYRELSRLAGEESSIRMRTGTEYLVTSGPDPWWSTSVPDFHRVQGPPAGFRDGWSFTAPVVDMSRYLPYLVQRLNAAGGTVTRATIDALPDSGDVVVNCAGLGARALVRDDSLTPVRGQVVYVEQFGLTEWLLADRGDDGLTYVVPRERDIVVGGTSQPGEWDRTPDRVKAGAILGRAARLVPQLATAAVLGHRAGLRPARPAIRCETIRNGQHATVHCYGHGGAGVTVSWGCADEVTREVARLAGSRPI